jgi:hypothetical protein
MITEAEETAYGKESALTHLFSIVSAGESFGVVSMYEVAALNAGATMEETERTIRAAKERRAA